MTSAYQNNPLEEEEIFNIAAFLRSAAKAKIPTDLKEASVTMKYYTLSLTGFIILLALLAGGWYTRKRSTVNDKIFKRQIKSEN